MNTPTLGSSSLPHIPMIKVTGKPNFSIDKNTKDCEVSVNELIIPSIIVEELINFYIELKKADKNKNENENGNDDETKNKIKVKTIGKVEGDSSVIKGYRKASVGGGNSKLSVPTSNHQRRRSYSSPAIPVNTKSSNHEEKSSVKPVIPPRRNNIPPVTNNRSPSFSIGSMKEKGKPFALSPKLTEVKVAGGKVSPRLSEMTIGMVSPRLSEIKIGKSNSPRLTEMISPRKSSLSSPMSALTSPNSATTIAANDILSTNYMYSPAIIPVNKKAIPPPNANVITVKHPKKSKLRKIKKMSLRVATNIVLKGGKEPSSAKDVDEKENYSPIDDTFSCHSSNSQSSHHRIDDLVMSPIATEPIYEDSPFSPSTAVFPGSGSGSASASASATNSPLAKITPYPPRNVSLARSRKSLSILSPNASIAMNNPMNRSNRFEDYLYTSSSPSSQTFFVNSFNSPSLSSQSQAYGTSPSMASPFMGPAVPSSATNIFNKDNLYRFKENNFNKFNMRAPEQTSVPVPYRKKPSTPFSPFLEPLPSLPANESNKTKFNPYDEPLPPFPLNQKVQVDDTNSYTSSQNQNQSQSQSQSQNQFGNASISSQLLSQSSMNSASNYNGLSFMEEQLLEEDDFEVGEILDKYNGVSHLLEQLPGSTIISNSKVNSHPLLFKSNNNNVIEGKNHPLFKNNGLTLEGNKFVSSISTSEQDYMDELEGEIEVPTYHSDDMIEDTEITEITEITENGTETEIETETENENESVQQFEEQLQRDVKELEDVVTLTLQKSKQHSSRIHDEDEDENDKEDGDENSNSTSGGVEFDEHHNSTLITDTSVIDSLECDLLNHKVQARKSSLGGLAPKSSFKVERLSSIDEVDEGELSDHTVVDDDDDDEDKTKEESVEDKKDLEEEKKKLDKLKKNQFRLSFLTSKSSYISLKDAFNKDKDNENGSESESESSSENENNSNASSYSEEEQEQERKIKKINEKKKDNDQMAIMDLDKEEEEEKEKDDELIVATPTPKTVHLSSSSNNEKKHLLSSNILTSTPKTKQLKSDDTSDSKSTSTKVYFVHPVQLYNIIQMIYIYTVAKLPNRAKPITQHWMAATNDMAIGFWDILKTKEDIISNIIIYSTFYDHQKLMAFPLNDPHHVFLKELVSSTEKDQQQNKKEEKEVILNEKPKLSTNTRNSNIYQKESDYINTAGEMKNNFENQAPNKKLIMEIKKELLI